MNEMRKQAASGALQPGASVRFERTFTHEDIERFGRLTRDYNPVHYDRRWSSGKGFREPICHGLLIGSMLCEPGGQWGCLATGMNFEFRKPVYPGETVSCELTIETIDDRGFGSARAECTNQDGELVLRAGLEGFFPSEAERELLTTMIGEGDPTNGLAV